MNNNKTVKHIAFLRGINVGGHNKIKMEALREMFAALGFENVKTYINSGNVIFETAETGDGKLSAQIEQAIESEFSLKIKVMVRTISEIEGIIKNNPFDGQFTNDKDLHVLFLAEALSEEKKNLLLANNTEFEQFAVRNREVFCLLRGGSILDSLLGKKYIDDKLKTPATARNWRTVKKLTEF